MTLQPHPGCCLPGTCLLLEFSMTLQPHPGSWSGTCRVLALNFTSCAAARAFRWFCIALHELDAVRAKAPPFSNQLPVFFHLWHSLDSWHHLISALCLLCDHCVGTVGPVAGLLPHLFVASSPSLLRHSLDSWHHLCLPQLCALIVIKRQNAKRQRRYRERRQRAAT